jgi:hypothetical protein
MRMEQEVMLPVRVRPARSCGPGFMQKQYCGHCCLLIAFCFKVFLLFNNLKGYDLFFLTTYIQGYNLA